MGLHRKHNLLLLVVCSIFIWGCDKSLKDWVASSPTQNPVLAKPAPTPTPSPSWSSVSSITSAAPTNFLPTSIANGPSGAVYVIGSYGDSFADARYGSITGSWAVLKSTDDGTTWTSVDSYQLTSGLGSSPLGIAVDTSENLFVAGEGLDANSLPAWIVRKSTNKGTSWSTVDNYQYAPGSATFASSIVRDKVGNIYAAGFAYVGTTIARVTHWLVRKSTDGGTTWSTVDDYSLDVTYSSMPKSIAVDSSGSVYVAGVGADVSGSHWIVRKSSNSGGAWTNIDNYQKISAQSSDAMNLVIQSNGSIFVVGRAGIKNSWVWIVRKGTTSSASVADWSDVDTYTASVTDAVAIAASIGPNGEVFVAGHSYDGTNQYQMILRQSLDSGTTWTTKDSFGTSTKTDIMGAAGLTVTPAGSLYFLGSYRGVSLNNSVQLRRFGI